MQIKKLRNSLIYTACEHAKGEQNSDVELMDIERKESGKTPKPSVPF